MAKKKFYSIKNLLSTDAQYMMLLGKRSNGKSYQVKHQVIEDFLKDGTMFIYLRRWQRDIKASAVEYYFNDVNVSKVTNGEGEGIRAWQSKIYLYRMNDKGKREQKIMGMYCALNEAERYKSWAFTGFGNIIYEEFITDQTYLTDEPTRLQQFVSTVFRLGKGRVYLVGNTLSRVCPYFHEWSLEGTLKQKQGTIEIYHYHDFEGDVVDIAVENCENTANKNTMFFGQAGKQIVSGEWDVKAMPHLPKPINEYEMVYEVMIVYQAFKFVMQLLVDENTGGRIIYVYPFTGHRKIHRIITDEFSDKPNITSCLIKKRRPEMIMIECLSINKVCYSDNLTGTDFMHVLEEMSIW